MDKPFIISEIQNNMAAAIVALSRVRRDTEKLGDKEMSAKIGKSRLELTDLLTEIANKSSSTRG